MLGFRRPADREIELPWLRVKESAAARVHARSLVNEDSFSLGTRDPLPVRTLAIRGSYDESKKQSGLLCASVVALPIFLFLPEIVVRARLATIAAGLLSLFREDGSGFLEFTFLPLREIVLVILGGEDLNVAMGSREI